MTKLQLIIVSGLPGTGKSVVAEGISEVMKIPVFSVDPIESSIIQAGIKKSFDTGLAAYLTAETLASEQLKLGLSVIIDAVSPVREAREMWSNLSLKYSAKLVVIECILEPGLHKKRIEARVRNMPGISEVTWQDVENRRKGYLEWKEDRLLLDTANNVEINLKKAL